MVLAERQTMPSTSSDGIGTFTRGFAWRPPDSGWNHHKDDSPLKNEEDLFVRKEKKKEKKKKYPEKRKKNPFFYISIYNYFL